MAVSGKRTVYDGWFCFEHSKIVDEIMAVITMDMEVNLIRKLMLCRWTFLSFQRWDVEFILLFLCNWYVFTNTKIIQVIDHTFYLFTGVTTHTGCWENTKVVCESRAEGDCTIYKLFEYSLNIQSRLLRWLTDRKCGLLLLQKKKPFNFLVYIILLNDRCLTK